MIYKFKMTTGRKDGFYREYELYSDSTLYDLHRHIQNDLDFDEAQMVAFYTSDNDWNKDTQYALFDMGNGAMDAIIIKDLIERKINYLVYTFDFYNNRSLLIEYVEIVDEERREHYPRTADGKGNPPNQLVDRPVSEPLPIDDLLPKKNKVNKNENDLVDDNDSIEEGDDLVDDGIDESDDYKEIDDALDNSDLDMLSETTEV